MRQKYHNHTEAQPENAIRTMEELESALDQHQISKWDGLAVAAIEAGNASDARAFATKLAHLLREREADRLSVGDDASLFADFTDERTFAVAA